MDRMSNRRSACPDSVDPMTEMGQPVQALQDMSGLPSLATELRTSEDVSNVPKTVVTGSFDYLVGCCQQLRRDFEAERFHHLQINHHLELGRLNNRQI